MINRILNSRTRSVTLASLILGIFYFISALLGLFRDRLLAGRFGAGDELDVYYAAFRIPDFIAMTLIMGAISAAIIPIFSQYLIRSKKEAWEFTSAFLNLFLFILVAISFVLVIFAPYIISLIVPGFSPEKKELTVALTRIMFLSPILLGISNVMSGILQVFHHFLVTAFAPVLYNLGIIFGILFLVPQIGIQGLAWGVVLGGLFHLLIQVPTFFTCGFRFQKILTLGHLGVRRVIKLMIPRSLGLAATQVNLIVVTAIASSLVSGSIAVFNLANNLSSLLINLIAVPFSTAVFPALSISFSQKNKEEFIRRFSSIFSRLLFLIVPLSTLIFILRAQIVRVVLGSGHFSWLDTRLTAACLGIFSIGLFAQGLSLLVSKTFYAAHNTKTPALISSISVVFTIGLAFFFVWLLGFSNIFSNFLVNLLKLKNIEKIAVIGLPLAVSLAAVFQLISLLFFLYKKIGDFKLKIIFQSLVKILTADIFLIITTYFLREVLANIVNMQTFLGIFLQAVSAGLTGLFIYCLIAFVLGLPEIKSIKHLIFKLLFSSREDGTTN